MSVSQEAPGKGSAEVRVARANAVTAFLGVLSALLALAAGVLAFMTHTQTQQKQQAQSQAQDLGASVQSLRQDNDKLQKDNASLQAQVSELRQQLATPTSQPSATPATVHWTGTFDVAQGTLNGVPPAQSAFDSGDVHLSMTASTRTATMSLGYGKGLGAWKQSGEATADACRDVALTSKGAVPLTPGASLCVVTKTDRVAVINVTGLDWSNAVAHTKITVWEAPST
jgi:cell division protein FtsB